MTDRYIIISFDKLEFMQPSIGIYTKKNAEEEATRLENRGVEFHLTKEIRHYIRR